MIEAILYFLVFIQFLLLLAALALTIFLAYTLYAFHTGAPFLPTDKKKVSSMISLAKLKPNETLIDLGSGDGRLLFEAAKQQPEAKIIGVEINPVLYYWSKIKKKIKGTENVEIKRKNLWDINLTKADVVTMFFIDHKMDKMEEKLKKETTDGTKIISHIFEFPNLEEIKSKDKNYLYKL